MPADPLEGGLYDRLRFESYCRWIRHGLAELGWFDAGRRHQPVVFRTSAVRADEKITPNLIVVSDGPHDVEDAELGSNAGFDSTEVWVTIYSENDALGRQLRGDVFSMVTGRFPSIGADEPGFTVYDLRTIAPDDLTYPPTVDELGWVELERPAADREHDPATGDERNTWYVVAYFGDLR